MSNFPVVDRGHSSDDWRVCYADYGPTELHLLNLGARAAFLERGLSQKTSREYARHVLVVERYCRERGTTAFGADASIISSFAETLTVAQRGPVRSALGHWWRYLGRVAPPLEAFRVESRETHLPPKRRQKGRAPGRPNKGSAWELDDSEVRARIRSAREAMRRSGLNATSTRQYCWVLWRAEQWCIKRGIELQTIDDENLEEFAETFPRSTSSRRHLKVALGHYFRALKRADPPLWAVRVPRKKRMIARPLEPAEVRKLMSVVHEDGGPRGLAIMLGLFLGLRRFEIAKARYRDFNGGWFEVIGKGDLSARLPVHPEVTRYLERVPRGTSEFLFPARSGGGSVNPTTVWNWVNDAAKEAGIEGLTTHRLRHTCLTYANDATKDLRAVQEFARHERPETTAGYTRASADRLLDIMRALGSAYGLAGADPLPALIDTSWSASLAEVVAGFSGPDYVGDWVALGDLLAEREGWSFAIAPDGCRTLSFHYDPAGLWAAVEDAWVVNPHRFNLFRILGPTEEDVAYWEFSDLDSLGVLLSTFESGDAPFPPTGTFGPGRRDGYLSRVMDL